MLIKSSDNTTNFSLGANATDTSLEVNRGNLILKTLQNNKNVAFENVAEVKLNRSKIQLGTEINAGFGGGTVKFIPEDTSIKTLQFYNTAPGDNRHFNLLVPEPTEATNPATKNYVDTKKTEATTYTDTKITETRNYIDTQISGINMVNSLRFQALALAGQSANSTKTNFGPFVKDTITITTNQTGVRVLNVTAQLYRGGGADLNTTIEFTYSTTPNYDTVYANFIYEGNISESTNWQFSAITI